MSPETFGIAAMATLVIGFGAIFQEIGLGAAVIQQAELGPNDLSTVFWVNVCAGIVLAGIVFAGGPLIATFYRQPDVVPVLRVLSVWFLIGALVPAQTTLLYRQLDFQSLALRQMIGVIAGGVVGLGMAVAGYGVWSLVGQALTSTAIGTVVVWIASPWRPRLRFDLARLRTLWGYGSRVTGTNVMRNLSRAGDRILVGRYLGATSLGYYQIAANWMMFPQIITNEVIGRVAFPALARVQDDLAKVRDAFLLITKLVALIFFPGMAGIAVIAPELVRAIYGPQWMPSAIIIQFLAVVGARQALLVMVAPVLQALGLVGLQLKWEMISLGAMLAAVIVGSPYGLSAVAGLVAASSIITLPFVLRVLCRAMKMPLAAWFGMLAVPAAIAAVDAALMSAVRLYFVSLSFPDYLVLIYTMAVGVVVYIGFQLTISRRDVTRLIAMFRE